MSLFLQILIGWIVIAGPVAYVLGKLCEGNETLEPSPGDIEADDELVEHLSSGGDPGNDQLERMFASLRDEAQDGT